MVMGHLRSREAISVGGVPPAGRRGLGEAHLPEDVGIPRIGAPGVEQGVEELSGRNRSRLFNWSRAAVRISVKNRSAPRLAASSPLQNLQPDWTIMLEVAGQKNCGHGATAELSLERIAVGEGVCQGRDKLGHAN
jgi:hypothetical protein